MSKVRDKGGYGKRIRKLQLSLDRLPEQGAFQAIKLKVEGFRSPYKQGLSDKNYEMCRYAVTAVGILLRHAVKRWPKQERSPEMQEWLRVQKRYWMDADGVVNELAGGHSPAYRPPGTSESQAPSIAEGAGGLFPAR